MQGFVLPSKIKVANLKLFHFMYIILIFTLLLPDCKDLYYVMNMLIKCKALQIEFDHSEMCVPAFSLFIPN